MAPKTGGSVYSDDGHVYGNFSEVQNLVDFTSTGILAQAEFEVLSAGSTSVNLDVEELSVGYLSGGVLNYRNAVKNSVTQNLSGVSGFSSNSLSGTSKLVNGGISAEESLTVNADSNFFKSASTKVGANAKKVTVTYKLTSSMKLINSQWILTYDSSKLSLSSDFDSLMPNVSNFTPNRYSSDTIKGNFTNINLQNFSKGKDFVTATFDVIGTGTANVNLDVRILGIAYKDSNDAVEAYIVDDGKVYDVTSQAGFSSETYSTATTITSDSYVWGDVNLDGKVNILDTTAVQRHCASISALADSALTAADADRNYSVDITDATLIQKYAAHMTVSGNHCGEYMKPLVETRTIYLDNNYMNLSNPCIYVWKCGTEDCMVKWPGTQMKNEGNNMYSYTCPKDYNCCIFLDGTTKKTGDLTNIPYLHATYMGSSGWVNADEAVIGFY